MFLQWLEWLFTPKPLLPLVFKKPPIVFYDGLERIEIPYEDFQKALDDIENGRLTDHEDLKRIINEER